MWCFRGRCGGCNHNTIYTHHQYHTLYTRTHTHTHTYIHPHTTHTHTHTSHTHNTTRRVPNQELFDQQSSRWVKFGQRRRRCEYPKCDSHARTHTRTQAQTQTTHKHNHNHKYKHKHKHKHRQTQTQTQIQHKHKHKHKHKHTTESAFGSTFNCDSRSGGAKD